MPHASAPLLVFAFVTRTSIFRRKTAFPSEAALEALRGAVDAQLGEALGEEFVNRASARPEQKTLHMTKQIERRCATRSSISEWMSAATKQKALEKLHAIVKDRVPGQVARLRAVRLSAMTSSAT